MEAKLRTGFWTLPNVISLMRLLFGAPTTIIFYHTGFSGAWLVFLFFVFLDWLDGFLARKYNSTSSLGMMLDPLADQFLILPILWYFGWNLQNYTLPVVLTLRECLMAGVRIAARRDMPANIWGKLKVVTEYAGVVLILRGLAAEGLVIMVFAMMLAYISLAIYMRAAIKAADEDCSA